MTGFVLLLDVSSTCVKINLRPRLPF